MSCNQKEVNMWNEQTDVSQNTDTRNYAVVLLEFNKTRTGINNLLYAMWELQYGGLVIKSLKKLMLGLPEAVWFGLSQEEANEIQKKLENGGIKTVVVRTNALQKIEEIRLDEGSEKSEYDVILVDYADKRIEVIKVIRAIMGLGIMDIRYLIDAPRPIKCSVSLEDALAIKKQLEDAGGIVEIRKSGN